MTDAEIKQACCGLNRCTSCLILYTVLLLLHANLFQYVDVCLSWFSVAVTVASSENASKAAVRVEKVKSDQQIVEQLLVMGFSLHACQRACLATGNSGAEAASNWMMEHMGDADFNDPLSDSQDIEMTSDSDYCPPSTDFEAVASLVDMGFSQDLVCCACHLHALCSLSPQK